MVPLAARKAEDLGHFAHRQAGVHGDEARDHRYVRGYVSRAPPGSFSRSPVSGIPAFVYVVEQLVAPRSADVQVNVGTIAALLVQETLEVKPPAQRADARDAQAVGDNRAR